MTFADDRPSKTLMIHRRFVLAEARHGKNPRHVAGFVFSLGVYRVFQTGICSSPPPTSDPVPPLPLLNARSRLCLLNLLGIKKVPACSDLQCGIG